MQNKQTKYLQPNSQIVLVNAYCMNKYHNLKHYQVRSATNFKFLKCFKTITFSIKHIIKINARISCENGKTVIYSDDL